MKSTSQHMKEGILQLLKDLCLSIIIPILLIWGILILVWDTHNEREPLKLFRLWDSWFWPKFFIGLGGLAWINLIYWIFYNH